MKLSIEYGKQVRAGATQPHDLIAKRHGWVDKVEKGESALCKKMKYDVGRGRSQQSQDKLGT
jgi:hypothetical protein